MDFGRIYEEYFRELQRYLLSLCRDSRIAEELTQETFFRAVRSAGQFREGSDLRAWLYTIARNVFLDQARRKRNTEIQLPCSTAWRSLTRRWSICGCSGNCPLGTSPGYLGGRRAGRG